MITIQASVSKGWLNTQAGFRFEEKYYLDPIFKLEEDRKINAFLRERFPDYALYNMEDNLVLSEYYNESLIQVGAIQPNMILAVALGAEFSFFGDKDADVRGLPLENIDDASELPPIESLLEHPFIKKLADDIVNLRQAHPELTVIPPFFWDLSGRAVIHGIITTSLKLVGENMMIIMMTDPELAHAIHLWVADAYIEIIRHFSQLAELPVTSVHVGECSGPMLSAGLFETFVTPYVSRLGEKLGAIRLHSCGNTDHLLEPISKIKNLTIIDTGSGTSIARIREIMGKNVEINVFPDVNLLLKNTPQADVKKWLDGVLQDNDGGDLKIAYHLEDSYNLENCLFIHDELERQGLITSGRRY